MSVPSQHPSGDTAAVVPDADTERLGRLQLLTRIAIREAAAEGMTAHEVSLATGIDRHSIQPRISELRLKGQVIAGGKRRRNPSGKTATVWVSREYADVGPQSPDTN